MAALVRQAADRLGGPDTHVGQIVLSFLPSLLDRFGADDVAFAIDQLRAPTFRPPAERDLVSVTGMPIGRNAILATGLRVGEDEALQLLSASFAHTLGNAVAAAIAEGDTAITQDPATRPPRTHPAPIRN